MCGVPYETADWSTTSHPVARKAHRCEECNGVIAVGERHARIGGAYEGSMFSYRLCNSCRAWGDAFWKAQREHCGQAWGWEVSRMWDEIAEFCEEHLGYSPDEQLNEDNRLEGR